MLRQRLRTRRFALADTLLRVVAVVIALALIWYGAMTVLLALKADPHTINSLSAYRTIYDHLAAITAADIGGRVRIIAAAAGVACFVAFASVAWRALPRPYLARGDLDLTSGGERGSTVVSARAIERAAEVAALADPLVVAAAGRYGSEDLAVTVTVRQASALADTLRAVQRRLIAALHEHELPHLPINVTLASVDRSHRREFD